MGKGKKSNNKFKASNEGMRKFYNKLFYKRECYSELSGKYLGNEPKSYMFDHLWEKSKYPEFADNEWNIVLCTLDEHHSKTNGFPILPHKARIRRFAELTHNDNSINFWFKDTNITWGSRDFQKCKININAPVEGWDTLNGDTEFLFFSALDLKDDILENANEQLKLLVRHKNKYKAIRQSINPPSVEVILPDDENYNSYFMFNQHSIRTKFFIGFKPAVVEVVCYDLPLSQFGKAIIKVNFGSLYCDFKYFLSFYNNV